MITLYTGLTVLLVFVSLAMIALILLQKGKGAEAGAAFGSGASGTVFGARGTANFLSRATAVLAAIFFVNCLALAYLGSQRSAPSSLLEEAGQVTEPGMIPADEVETTDRPDIGGEEPAPAEAEFPDLPDEVVEPNEE